MIESSCLLKRLLLLSVSIGALAVAQAAEAIRIDGLGLFDAVDNQPAKVQVHERTLTISIEGRAPITIAPWAGYLPQRFKAQHVEAMRTPHPAGPVDRVALRNDPAAQPWLVVTTGVRAGQRVVGGWTLERSAGRWTLRDGNAWRALRAGGAEARPAVLRDKGGYWCVYLLSASEAVSAASGVAHESTAEIAFAAVRGTTAACARQSSPPK